jgi:glycosyltransferase involved in cell wall biosynthesis
MITVVIASYNHAQYLPLQLASIIRQGPSVSRIVVVNDASTDNTKDVLEKIQLNEPRLIVKNLSENVGCWQAFHTGLNFVDTDFFAFVAADDLLMPDWAEKSLNALQSAPDIGMCFSCTFVANDKSATLTKTVIPMGSSGVILPPADFHRSLMKYGSYVNSSTLLMRRSAYDENFVKFAPTGALADAMLINIIGLKAGAVFVDEVLGVFFERDTSISGSMAVPHASVKILQELSNTLGSTLCVEVIDQRLAVRLLRRTFYTYLMGSTNQLASEYSQIAERVLPSIISRVLRILLWLLLNFQRLLAFACLRPFDLTVASKCASRKATLDETRAIVEYRKVLNDTLPLIGLE